MQNARRPVPGRTGAAVSDGCNEEADDTAKLSALQRRWIVNRWQSLGSLVAIVVARHAFGEAAQ